MRVVYRIVKGQRHHGDEHVQEGNLCDKGCQEEEYPDEHIVCLLVSIVLIIKLTQANQVLFDYGVNELVAELLDQYGLWVFILDQVEVDDVARIGKGEHNNKQKDSEDYHIPYCVNEHSDDQGETSE